MDAGALKILDSVTAKTLHAHSFARSSTQASLTLTDLLSRYLLLLSSTCAQYAQHAGRTDLSVRDAVCALGELGVSVEELSEYCQYEGEELAKYAGHSAKRLEDLNSFKASLSVGLPPAREAMSLIYGPVPDELQESSDDEYEEMSEGSQLDVNMDELEKQEAFGTTAAEDSDAMILDNVAPIQRLTPTTPRRTPSPPLPLSPVSNPSSPARKRARTDHWCPPPHIPDYLPPFPSDRTSPAPEAFTLDLPSQSTPPPQVSPVKTERPPIPHLPIQPSSGGLPDYLTAVPYHESSLASAPEWHLPSAPPPSSGPTASSIARLPTPQLQPSLLAAYHHVLTHPPPANPNAANAARHRVAVALLQQAQKATRWEPADTLYAATAPNAPAVAAIGPTYPIPIDKTLPGEDGSREKAEEKERRSNLPPVPPRSLAQERLAPLASQQSSRIPELARLVLPGSVLSRTTRLGHPPFIQGDTSIVHRPSVPAPWNSAPAAATPAPVPGKGKEALANGVPNGKAKDAAEKEEKPLPDARYYATWQFEQKSYKEPLPLRRLRQGSIQTTRINLPVPGRATSESRAS
ncbi:hypothetical protein EWM64_g5730 [Hericium alpestre]|uniref:Bromodomain associated domain-containing protein n=1 Tax=Hericium alpestre TaxID=135208 RepID=A0A4Y9ZU01_9AGAM|nr:hypothetical protein EWM64_g5730 [Hericium alpestre]